MASEEETTALILELLDQIEAFLSEVKLHLEVKEQRGEDGH